MPDTKTDEPYRVIVELVGTAPYSQSRCYKSVKGTKETSDDFEQRVWREHLHVDDKDMVFIPAMSFKNALVGAARYRGEQIRGQGKKTYTQKFMSAVMVTKDVALGIKGDAVQGEALHLNADGKKGGNTRVWRTYPRIDDWKATVVFDVCDPIISLDVFKRTLTDAGNFIGIGRFRPERGGFYGRFRIKTVKVEAL